MFVYELSGCVSESSCSHQVTFIEKAMSTLSVCNQKFKKMVEYRTGAFGNILNLSKHSLSLGIYKLLNKNLNFVPTPKQYKTKQLDTDTKIFFRLFKTCQSKMPVKTKQTNYFKLLKSKPKETHLKKHITPLKLLEI